MKQYLKIQNEGKVDIKAYQKAGFSTKSNDSSKIGEFGTGANFACIWAIRENIEIKIFSGHREVILGKVSSLFRGEEVEYLTVDGTETSFSLNMGKRTWKGWMAIREFWCNALDECGANKSIVIEEDIISEDNKTNIYLEINEEIKEVISNWNRYFSNERSDLLYSGNNFKIYTGGDNLVVYRKGIQCFTYNAPSIFHYDLDTINVSDSRIVEDKYDMDIKIANILAKEIPEELIIQLCEKIKGSYEFNLNWDWYYVSFDDKWEKALKNKVIVEDEFKDMYQSSIENTSSTIYTLPRTLSKTLTNNKNIEHVAGVLANSDDGGEILELTTEETLTLNLINNELENVGYFVNYPIKSYIPKNKGSESTNLDKVIYLSKKLIDSNILYDIKSNIIKQNEFILAKDSNITKEKQLLNSLLTKLNIKKDEIPRIIENPII